MTPAEQFALDQARYIIAQWSEIGTPYRLAQAIILSLGYEMGPRQDNPYQDDAFATSTSYYRRLLQARACVGRTNQRRINAFEFRIRRMDLSFFNANTTSEQRIATVQRVILLTRFGVDTAAPHASTSVTKSTGPTLAAFASR